jgi:hypothetical protein
VSINFVDQRHAQKLISGVGDTPQIRLRGTDADALSFFDSLYAAKFEALALWP